MKKYDITKQAKIINVSLAGVMLAVGVIIAVFSSLPDLIVKILIGCLLIITGVGKVLGYFSNDIYRLAFQFDLAIGVTDAILGILTLVLADAVYPTLATGMGIYVILDSLLKVQTGLDARRFGMKSWLGILISSAAISLFGIASMLAAHLILPMNIPVGTAMAADAVQNMWITMYTVRVRAKKKSFKVDFDLKEDDEK